MSVKVKRIDYYFHTDKNEQQLNELVKSPLFQKIIDFFRLQNEEPVLLRRLKEAVVSDENIEYILEKMITYNLVERNERRYKLLIPIYDANNTTTLISQQNIDSLLDFSKTINQTQMAIFLGEWLWEKFFPQEVNYFFGIERELEDDRFFYKKIEIGNHEFQFVSIQNENVPPTDLATYFSILKTNQIPTAFQPLHELIGDVDINYYISQAKRIIRNADKNRKVSTKRNIFQESLIFSGDVSISKTNQLVLASSLVSAGDQPDLSEGKAIVSLLLEDITKQSETTITQRILIKKYLYREIFQILVKNQGSISYIKKLV